MSLGFPSRGSKEYANRRRPINKRAPTNKPSIGQLEQTFHWPIASHLLIVCFARSAWKAEQLCRSAFQAEDRRSMRTGGDRSTNVPRLTHLPLANWNKPSIGRLEQAFHLPLANSFAPVNRMLRSLGLESRATMSLGFPSRGSKEHANRRRPISKRAPTNNLPLANWNKPSIGRIVSHLLIVCFARSAWKAEQQCRSAFQAEDRRSMRTGGDRSTNVPRRTHLPLANWSKSSIGRLEQTFD